MRRPREGLNFRWVAYLPLYKGRATRAFVTPSLGYRLRPGARAPRPVPGAPYARIAPAGSCLLATHAGYAELASPTTLPTTSPSTGSQGWRMASHS